MLHVKYKLSLKFLLLVYQLAHVNLDCRAGKLRPILVYVHEVLEN